MHPDIGLLASTIRSRAIYLKTVTNGQPDNITDSAYRFNEIMFSLDYINGPPPINAHQGDPKRAIETMHEIRYRYPNVKLAVHQVINAHTRPGHLEEVETYCREQGFQLIQDRIANFRTTPSIDDQVRADRMVNGPLDWFEPYCPWGFTWAYYDVRGRLHPCCLRMTEEYQLGREWNGPEMLEFRKQRMELNGGGKICRNCPD
jgi:MoaA/NifB/PqqE/SkfB family radical SAM enzyme